MTAIGCHLSWHQVYVLATPEHGPGQGFCCDDLRRRRSGCCCPAPCCSHRLQDMTSLTLDENDQSHQTVGIHSVDQTTHGIYLALMNNTENFWKHTIIKCKSLQFVHSILRIRIILFCQRTTYRNSIYKKAIITYMPTWRLLLRPFLVAIIGPPGK